MNKLTKSTKVGLTTGAVLLGSTLLYLVLFKSSNPSPNPNEGNSSQVNQSINLGSTKSVNLGQGSEEVAPVYSDIESSDATIQISEETKQNSPAPTIPQGFGLGKQEGTKSDAAPQENVEEPLKQLPVDLETPVESQEKTETQGAKNDLNQSGIETMDPREVGVTANDGPDKDYEETVLTVQRTLTAVNPDGEKQLIRLKIPVMYKSRVLRLEGPTQSKAQEILARLKTKGQELSQIKAELESTLIEWNQLVTDATPYEVLLPESPTLPQNQSAGRINREDNPSMSAGKAISYEIINK